MVDEWKLELASLVKTQEWNKQQIGSVQQNMGSVYLSQEETIKQQSLLMQRVVAALLGKWVLDSKVEQLEK